MASRRLQIAPADYFVSCGKRRAAPSARTRGLATAYAIDVRPTKYGCREGRLSMSFRYLAVAAGPPILIPRPSEMYGLFT